MAFATPPYAAHIGGQDEKSMMGVIGTLGTADLGGTAPILPVGVDPLTGALYVEVISGTTTTSLALTSGTLSTLGTVANLNNGSINILSGTLLNTGTFVNISTGTVNLVTTVSNVTNGSINILSGTLLNTGTFVNIATGTQQTLGTVGVVNNIVTGTLANSGTTTGVGVVSALTTGSVIIQSGTLTAGTLPVVTTVSNLTNGSVNILTGTLQNSGTTTGVGVVSNLTNGSIILQSGTLSTGTLQNLVSGTINALASGTITGGTLQNLVSGTITSVANLAGGTVQVNQLPTNKMTTYGTQGTAGAGTIIGTIQGTVGAGTEAIVSDWSIVVISGTPQVGLMFGSAGGAFPQGTGVIEAGQFPPGGGIAKGVESSLNSGTNGQICYMISAGTAYFKVSYYPTATTI